MSHFYGTVQGNRGEASRGGSKHSGMTTHCASWAGSVRCNAYQNAEGIDCVRVTLGTWQGRGQSPSRLLYEGPISGHRVVATADMGAP